MLQSVHHAAILVVEQLQDGTILLLYFDQVVHFFLVSVHGRGILIEVAGKDDQVTLFVVLRVIQSLELHKSLHLFDLFKSTDKRLNVQRHTFAIIARLIMGME